MHTQNDKGILASGGLMLALPKILPAHLHDVSPMVVVAARIRPSICFTLAIDNFSVN